MDQNRRRLLSVCSTILHHFIGHLRCILLSISAFSMVRAWGLAGGARASRLAARATLPLVPRRFPLLLMHLIDGGRARQTSKLCAYSNMQIKLANIISSLDRAISV